MARDHEALNRVAGVEFHMVPAAEQSAEIGTEAYHGGAVLPDDASVHPALYHKGLVGVAMASSVSYSFIGLGVLIMVSKSLGMGSLEMAVPKKEDFFLLVSKINEFYKLKR